MTIDSGKRNTDIDGQVFAAKPHIPFLDTDTNGECETHEYHLQSYPDTVDPIFTHPRPDSRSFRTKNDQTREEKTMSRSGYQNITITDWSRLNSGRSVPSYQRGGRYRSRDYSSSSSESDWSSSTCSSWTSNDALSHSQHMYDYSHIHQPRKKRRELLAR